MWNLYQKQEMQLKDNQLFEIHLSHYSDARHGLLHVHEMVLFIPSGPNFKVLVADFALAQKRFGANRTKDVLHQHVPQLKDLWRLHLDLGDDTPSRNQYRELVTQGALI